ncbi:MAG: methyltransferase domain-containing protein [Candidatus Omnitrophica bacterium]|nr:methyltransferase domain-containing protein [Candidatus Omnitrophota bacterium]
MVCFRLGRAYPPGEGLIALSGESDQAFRYLPGEKILDLDPGPGYWTFKLAKAAGPEGHVYGIQVYPETSRSMDEYMQSALKDDELNPYDNVTLMKKSYKEQLLPPHTADMAFLSLCGYFLGDPDAQRRYHDRFYRRDRVLVENIYRSLKPGGKGGRHRYHQHAVRPFVHAQI